MKFSKHSSPYLNRLALFRHPTNVARAVALAAMILAASLPFFSFSAQAANTEDDYVGSTTGNITTATNFSLLAVPTVANDFVFPVTAATGIRSFGAGATPGATNVTAGSLNDFSQATTVSIANATSSASTVSLTLGGAGDLGNSVSGTGADLLFVANGGTLNLNAGTTAVLNVVLGQSGNFDVVGTGASNISSVISDGGSGFGITKIGAGTLTLSGANTFSGGLNLNAGTVSIGAVNNLGTGTVSFGGGTLAITAAVDPSAQFSQAANQAYNISNTVATTIATALTSTGGTLTKAGASTLTSTAANTFTGATTVNGGSLALSGAGSLASTTINLQSGTAGGGLILTNTGAGFDSVNRIADTATINLGGGSFVIGGSDQATTNVSETVGSFTLGAGTVNGNTTNIITVTPGTGGTTTLTAGSITRAAGATMGLINGTGLGSSATSASQFFVTSTPTLVGTTAPLASGINAAAKNTQIVTGLVGETTATTGGLGTVTGNANTFLTYTATGGFRPLNLTDEFATATTLTAGMNDRTTAATSMTANTTINSLVVNGASVANNTLTLSSGTTLTDSSGMILFAPTANVASTITGGTVAFGATEGFIYAGGTTGTNQVIASAVTGSNGITVSGPGLVTISGPITLSGGTLANTQHSLTLNGSNNLAGASVVSSAGNGGVLSTTSIGALTGASSLTLTNNSQFRDTSAPNIITATVNLGDATTTGNLYLAGIGYASNFTFSGQFTLNSPQLAVIQSYNQDNNSTALTGGITSVATTGTGGIEFQGAGGGLTYDHRISLSGTLNYVGPTQIASQGGNLRVALVNTTLPSSTVLGFRNSVVGAADISQFDLNGNNQTVAGLQTIAAGTGTVAQVVNSSATASAFTVNNTSNYTFLGNLGTVGAINSSTTGGQNTAPNATGSTATIIQAAGTANGFSLVKTGTGTLTLSGAGSFTGGTAINGGKILITNGTALGAGGVTIGTGANAGALATAPGALTVANLITTGGTGSVLSPGATAATAAGAVGSLTLSGGLNLAAGGTIPFDLATTSATSDLITVSGGAFTGATGTGSGSVTFAFNNLGATVGTTYSLINFAGATSSTDVDLSDFTATGIAGSFQFNAAGNELDFITAIPEPATYFGGLLIVAAFGWGVRGRFARRAV